MLVTNSEIGDRFLTDRKSNLVIENDELPRKLYRFRSAGTPYFWNELEQAIHHQSIFLARATWQNDPFDFKPRFIHSPIHEINTWAKSNAPKGVVSRERYQQLAGRGVSRREFRKKTATLRRSPVAHAKTQLKLAEQTFNLMPNETVLACFSEVLHNAPMWAHYADNHQGVCIEFSIDWEIKADLPNQPLRVEYKTDRPSLSTVDILNYSRREITNLPEQEALHIFEKLCLIKSTQWEYEKEWRVFFNTKENPRYYRLPAFSVSSLIFGINTSASVFDKARAEYKGRCDLFRAVASKDKFEFELSDL